ncbi:hypothetical protein VIGAN_02289500, partial [Vigna angularis var. angularis]
KPQLCLFIYYFHLVSKLIFTQPYSPVIHEPLFTFFSFSISVLIFPNPIPSVSLDFKQDVELSRKEHGKGRGFSLICFRFGFVFGREERQVSAARRDLHPHGTVGTTAVTSSRRAGVCDFMATSFAFLIGFVFFLILVIWGLGFRREFSSCV